jgi:uncharacterized protein
MTTITRREFAKQLGGLGIGGMLALGGCGPRAGETPPAEQAGAAGHGKLRRLGETDLVLSRVGFGAQRTQDPDLIRYALDQGINHIETSWLYGMGGTRNNNCKCLGKAIAGRRDSVCLSVAYEALFPPEHRFWLPHQFEQTLRDLGTDHVDLFLWHHPGNAVPKPKRTVKECQAMVAAGQRVDLMHQWKAQGKIRWCGVTMHLDQVEWLEFVAASGLYDVAVVAFNYNSPRGIAKAMQAARRKGIGLIAMKTQSPNYLDGEGTIGNAPDHRQALSWVLAKDYVSAAIPGMTTRAQVDLNLQTLAAMT